MRPADFIRSKLLDRKRKFIGLMSFPEARFEAVRREIFQWILLREQEMARQLGKTPPSQLPITEDAGDGVMVSATDNRSLIEFAVSSDMEQTGAAIRYFHFFIDKRGRGSDKKFVQVDKEGFITTFVFQRKAASKELFLWMRLEYSHSSLWPARPMPPSTPRIFNEIIKKIPGVELIVHEQTPVDIIEREWRESSRYEDVEAAVKRERRRAARAGGHAGQGGQTSVAAEPVVPVKPGLTELLSGLRQAVASLHGTCVYFFDRKDI